MNTKRLSVFLLFVAACSSSAAAGFWFGFREAWWLGPAADSIPRGALALVQIKAIAAGKSANIGTFLESDVDTGLTIGYLVFHHPLRDLLKPVWGIEVYPEYEKYAVRLANYRKERPSETFKPSPTMLGTPLSEASDILAEGHRIGLERLNFMVERYATKP
jgi:hypothetical protein